MATAIKYGVFFLIVSVMVLFLRKENKDSKIDSVSSQPISGAITSEETLLVVYGSYDVYGKLTLSAVPRGPASAPSDLDIGVFKKMIP